MKTSIPFYAPRPGTLRRAVRSAAIPVSAETQQYLAEVNDPARLMGLNLGLTFVFIQFTKLHELLTIFLHVNTFLLYFVGIPTYILLIGAGGLQRTWRYPQARYWIGLTFWMVAAVPTSLWVADSLSVVMVYVRTEVLVLFLIVSFVITWRDFEKLMSVLALAAVVNVVAGRLLQKNDLEGRMELAGGTMADPNDFAALLILMLPFLLLVVISPDRGFVKKAGALGLIVVGLFMILSTASRGAEVGLALAAGYALLRLDLPKKILAVCGMVAVLGALVMILPPATVQRLGSIFSSSADANDLNAVSALESKGARTYLLRESALAAVTHPIVGVGEEQFQNYEGARARSLGQKGVWHEAHNTYTQIASETGLPGFFFLAGGIISTFRLLSRTYREARGMPRTPQNVKICATFFCVMVSLIGFCAAIFFLSMAYRFYLPAFTGIAIALTRAVEHEWRSASPPTLGLGPSLR